MIRERPLTISPYIIESWQREILRATPEHLKEEADLCVYQQRSWMASARETKSVGARPWVEVNMAWKYHRHLMMLLRAQRKTKQNELTQASLF